MNLVLDISQFTIANSYFLDTRRNIIIDGNFTKLVYSAEEFSMNGIYFSFPIEAHTLDKISSKYIIKFNPYSKNNQSVSQDFSKLEYKVLEYYKQMYGKPCKIVNSLSKQIYSGSLKIYRDYSIDARNPIGDDIKTAKFILKVSGVWETKDDIGITFKLFQKIDEFL